MYRRILALAALFGSACASGQLDQVRIHQPPEPRAVATLIPGQSTLDDCLRSLGAPTTVEEQGEGAVLTWAWDERSRWSLRVSVPLAPRLSGYLQYARAGNLPERLHLEFDREWKLVQVLRERGSWPASLELK